MNFEETFKKMSFGEKLAKLTELNTMTELERREKIWSRELDELYDRITENWLKEYVEAGYVNPHFYRVESDEYEYYDIMAVEVFLACKFRVVLEPVGINVTGAFGVTDLYWEGHKDEKVSLLLIQDEDDSEKLYWEIWKGRKQEDRIPLNKETFESLLNEWLERWAEIDNV